MSQIIKKFIGNNQVGGAQARLENNTFLRGRNAADSADIDIIKVNPGNNAALGVNLDASGFIVSNVLVEFDNLATDPGSPTAGLVYYNTTSNELKYYNGTAWQVIGSGGGGANQTLSNLTSPTAINQNLYFDMGAASALSTKNYPGGGSFDLYVSTGAENGASTGVLYLKSGANDAGDTGAVNVASGDATGGTSGNVNIAAGTGTTVGNVTMSGTLVEVTANRLDLLSNTLLGLSNQASDPTGAAGDVYYNTTANELRYYNGTAWVASSPAKTPNKETFVLSSGDITNQYVDLAHVASTGSILFIVKGGGAQLEGASYDYSVNYTGGAGGNTRLTFLNDLATGGGAALVAGDVLQINYVY